MTIRSNGMMNVWIQNPFDNLPTEGYRKQRFWLMAEAFVRAGHRVVYWTSDFSHARKESRSLKVKANKGGFKFQVPGFKFHGEGEWGNGQGELEMVMIPTRPYRKNVSWARVRSHRAYAKGWERAVMDFTKRPCDIPDLIIASTPTLSGAAMALKLGRRFGACVVIDVMDAWPETFERLAPKGFRWLAKLPLALLRRTAQRIYREADLVTGVCERYRELTGRADYYLAYHGIEADQSTSEGERRSGEGIRLAYVGNLGKSYDLKTVVEGVVLLRREGVAATLDVAGFGGTVPDADGVRFHGLLDETALVTMLASCDIGIIPMKPDSWVGLPYKLCDYARAGLRIVSSLGGESERLLARYGCGIGYRAGDAESFAAAVREAMRLPADAGRRLVEQELSAETIYDAYCKRVCTQRIVHFCAGLTGYDGWRAGVGARGKE